MRVIRGSKRRAGWAAGLVLVAGASLYVAGGQKGAATDQDWPIYLGKDGDHYSTLTQINRANAKNLKQAWRYDSGDDGQIENSPIVVGRTLYAATYSEKIIALDAATGKLIWKFDPQVAGTQPIRGVSYWKDGDKGRILAGAMNYLFELDADTGQPVESFGMGGHIDLRENLDTDAKRASVVMTTPGVVYKDTIIVGYRAPETHPAPHGDIRAFDLKTGQMRWTFHTIPHPGEFGYETWPEGAWKTAGAANDWSGLTLDAERGIVFAPTGSAVDDFYGADRKGNDLFANTLLALDAATGKRLWHFQGVHHDMWDRDFPCPPVLLTVKRDGKDVAAVAQLTKQGYVYLFDRVTGKPLFPIEEMKVEQATVPGEFSSPTQPHPLLPEPYARQVLTENDLTQRTPEAHAWALEQFKKFHVGTTQFVPLSADRLTVMTPSFDGGAEWGGQAVDIKTGVLYVNANNVAGLPGVTANIQRHGAGMTVYLSQCSVCHGGERKGSPPEFPSLVGVSTRLTNQQITDVIHGGRGRMPSFPNVQGDVLAALENYLRTGVDEGPQIETSTAPAHVTLIGTPEAAKAHPEAAALFASKCAVCHGARGTGTPPAIPSVVGVGLRQSAEQVAGTIHNGRGGMPAFPKLTDVEANELTRYLGARDITGDKELQANGGAKLLAYRFTGYERFLDPDGYPATATPWGTLSAIDMNTGKYLWKIPFGEYPELVAQGMPGTGTENYGGPIVTAGGVMFIAATIFDRQFHVFDTKTGELLWHTELPFGGLATPVTYMIDGKQYVMVEAGGGKDSRHALGGAYIAFTLP